MVQMNDCYYFLYSNCTKVLYYIGHEEIYFVFRLIFHQGTSCPFRHCEAARKSETLCSRYEAGQCASQECSMRHSTFHLEKNRKAIPCYWEMHGGCSRSFCPFKHILKSDVVASEKPHVDKEGNSEVPKPGMMQAPKLSPSLQPSNESQLNHLSKESSLMKNHGEVRSDTTRISSENVSRQHKENPGNFQPHPVDFKVKSLEEILREKNLQTLSPNLSPANKEVTEKPFPRHSPSPTTAQQNHPGENIRQDLLLEKRLKRFGPNIQKSSSPLSDTQLGSTNSFPKTVSVDVPTTPSFLPAVMNGTGTTLFSLPLVDRRVDTSQSIAVASDSERMFPRSSRPTEAPTEFTEKVPTKRPRIGDSKTASPVPLCPLNSSTTNRTLGNLPDDEFYEFEKDLNLGSCQAPLNYNEEDLDKQLAEMEHMLR
jgi:hypothetical protein